MVPGLDAAHAEEQGASQLLERCEQALAAWQQTWDDARSGGGHGPARDPGRTGAHRAAGESTTPLAATAGAAGRERSALAELQPPVSLEILAERAAAAREAGQKAATELQELLAEFSVTRDREREQTQALNALRARWQQALGSQVSTEALQQAALGKVSGKVTQWLKSQSLDRQPRVAQQLRVERGWERAVETVLGSYLEAVCVDGLDSVTDLLASFDGGHLAVVSLERAAPRRARFRPRCRRRCRARRCLNSVLSSVYTAETLTEALGCGAA